MDLKHLADGFERVKGSLGSDERRKDVHKADKVGVVKLITLFEEKFSDAKARRFQKGNLNTVKIDISSKSDQGKTVSEGIFLNDQYFRARS